MLSTQFGTNGNAQRSGEAPGSGQQILYAALLVVVIYLVFIFIEVIYNYYNRMTMNRTELLPNTYVMNDKKSDILNLINNDILKKTVYTIENTKGINRTVITIMAEIYMRYYDEIKSVRYFLSKREYFLLIEKPFIIIFKSVKKA